AARSHGADSFVAPCPGYTAPMTPKKRLLMAIVGFLAAGSLSSWMSRHSCELRTAHWLSGTVRPGTQFFVRRDEADPRRLAIWNAAGANYRVHDPNKDGPKHFPWCSIGRTESWLPFL